MIAAAWAWFLGTPVGKALGWIAGGAAVVVGLLLGYEAWRSHERGVGASTQVAKQEEADQEVADHADTIEDRNRVAGAESARDGLREYETKHAK